jgi:tetratricopeptide (TPR) repeat protein
VEHDSWIEARGRSYRAEVGKDQGAIRERGPQGEKAYPLKYVMGGKNVLYFLTPVAGGRLQVLPLAFDARRKEWYDTAGSMVRHIPGIADSPIEWTDRALTFNSSCYNCHVSQLAKNYSLATDTYQTTWKEPGINCEACHGPGLQHVRAMLALKDKPVESSGIPPEKRQIPLEDRQILSENLQIIVTRQFTEEQTNSMCAPCHAKMNILTASCNPGDDFFDHYNIVCLEDRDFYPDGRDLGENFTYTLWLMSPCAASGQLDCLHCHTSSGRDKHAADPDKACAPCHEKHVADPAAHSHHKAESEGSRCVACHMPMTAFARMRRHDHTLLAPTPAATLKFQSPNACNICHEDKDAAWADAWVRKWYPRDYQAPLLERATLIDAARKEDWNLLGPMLSYVTGAKRDQVFAASLLRLLGRCQDPAKWPAFIQCLRDPSPLVRAAAAAGLGLASTEEARAALIEAAGDSRRVVRILAASSLARHPLKSFDEKGAARVARAFAEYEASMTCQPDDPAGHYNMGNYLQDRGDLAGAIARYDTALRLRPDFVPALVNKSMIHARAGNQEKAEAALREALHHEPGNAEASFNLGLLVAEQGRAADAEALLRAALKADPGFAEAAYNLAVLISVDRLDETIALCRKAVELRPEEPKYRYTLAFYSKEKGDTEGAMSALRELIERHPEHAEAYGLLGALYEEKGRTQEALQLYRTAAQSRDLPEDARTLFESKILALEGR